MTDISDAAISAALRERYMAPDMSEYPLMRRCLTAALPHLVPRELLIEAAEELEYQTASAKPGYHRSHAINDLALRLRQAAGE